MPSMTSVEYLILRRFQGHNDVETRRKQAIVIKKITFGGHFENSCKLQNEKFEKNIGINSRNFRTIKNNNYDKYE